MLSLKKKREFERAFKKGTRIKRSLVSISYFSKDAGEPQYAFVAAKRLGNAVYRNRCKRLLREAVRGTSCMQESCDIIFFATPKTIHAKPASIREEIERALKEHADKKRHGRKN